MNKIVKLILVVIFTISTYTSINVKFNQCGTQISSYTRSVPFPCGVWGSMWNSIALVPDHCLFIYLEDVHVTIQNPSDVQRRHAESFNNEAGSSMTIERDDKYN